MQQFAAAGDVAPTRTGPQAAEPREVSFGPGPNGRRLCGSRHTRASGNSATSAEVRRRGTVGGTQFLLPRSEEQTQPQGTELDDLSATGRRRGRRNMGLSSRERPLLQWLRESIKDNDLASAVERVEALGDVDPRESRKQVREAIEHIYTLPGPGPLPVPGAFN